MSASLVLWPLERIEKKGSVGIDRLIFENIDGEVQCFSIDSLYTLGNFQPSILLCILSFSIVFPQKLKKKKGFQTTVIVLQHKETIVFRLFKMK